jgi:hypothetical protein
LTWNSGNSFTIIAKGINVNNHAGRVSTSTLCAIAAVAFIIACVAHEAIGHGGLCLIMGGEIKLLTSVYFRCVPGRPVVDAAGPTMNLIVAILAAAMLANKRRSDLSRAFLAFLIAFNGFWGAGYLIFSAFTNTGDWAFVLRDLSAQPIWLWRIIMAAAGIYLYGVTLRYIAPHLPLGWPLLAAYLVVGAVACASTLFFTGAILPAMQEAAQESLLASVALIYLAFRRSPSQQTTVLSVPIPHNRSILIFSVLLVVLFWMLLGRGISVI